ncbi:conserved hypothetical protein [Solidesulfovibrio fructosivorans JJ]]|uniref:Uncharacterized protein n=1 Tax=Solidesulfovibrio fructosivorans JJ] TaxID=596151 RepID=E1JSG8_SOLFR|nr:hypothetical protein [Solidesulfovibrio fructosivorans]EFL52937.1 conserved hypothetical protein [Solidesulfovibrio fructosivorans JJ]]
MEQSTDVRQAVLGAATGYALEQVLPFVVSLKKTGYAGRICLFVWDMDQGALRVLERLGVELYPCASQRTDKRYTVTGGRFFVFREFLLGQKDRLERLMLTDVRDVAFQRDPFTGLSETGAHCFLEREDHCLGSETFNADAMRRAYGEDALRELADRPISCVGVTAGDRDSMLAYLDALTDELAAMAEDFFGSDQAAHNRIVHAAGAAFVRLHGSDTPHVLHMGLVPPGDVPLDARRAVCNSKGDVVAVLHQYDRHPEVAARLRESLF